MFHQVRSQIQYKIILPFLLLTLLVALAGSAVSILYITSTAQDRLNNQLAQVARATSDGVVELEQANLQFLREVAFAGANQATGAPAVAQAFASGEQTTLAKALDPYFIVSAQRQGLRVDRLIAFDTSGQSVVDWEYAPDQQGSLRASNPLRNLRDLWFVPAILAKQRDALGDKYSGLLELGDESNRYLFTVAPVANGDQVVGGLIVATRLESALQELSQRSSSAIVSVYRADDGVAFASTQVPAAGLATLQLKPSLIPAVRTTNIAERQAIFDTVTVNERQYQFAYAPLRVRGEVIGLLSVALSSDYVIGPWANAGVPLMILTAALMLSIVALGVLVARQITHPLQELVATAEAVTTGDFSRRSDVQAHDEVGTLSRSFNEMTEHLVDLYGAVRAEATQRAAIVESISDGVVVCDPNGQVLVINRAMRGLLGLDEQQPTPTFFHEIPLQTLGETTLAFGDQRSADMFTFGGKIVRIAVAPVATDEGTRLGDVYVFQDLTSEVAVDRAKTNFIATISHELRTPLTVLSGSADLLRRGFVGELNDEQRTLVEAMHKRTQEMTGLLNNVIIIAGLDSGTLTFVLEPLCLRTVVEEALWNVRAAICAKNLELIVEIPADLPAVIADAQQLRNVFHQLLDNARRYTARGSVSISASCNGPRVRVDIRDTGQGIDSEASANLFRRFVRGAEGINSTERGIGLGLTIARTLIERQGGELWLAETSEDGSTFSFTIDYDHANVHTNNQALVEAA